MSSDLPSSRIDTILARLASGQPVRAGALAREFGVSEDAIRRDLRSLAAEGLCRRVYGGALPIVEGATPMAARVGEDVQRKQMLADAALRFVEPGSFVFVDNGSSNLALVERLPPQLDLAIATSSVTIAAAVQHRDAIDLLVIGGMIDRLVGGAVDGTALEAIARLNIDLCVLGACAVSAEGASVRTTPPTPFSNARWSRGAAGRSSLRRTTSSVDTPRTACVASMRSHRSSSSTTPMPTSCAI
ncbi:DeoR/GlpR family DNA-binding transcription regulator [Sphingomonas sp. 22R3R2A-7]